jgi:hypothetical protein
VFVQSQTDLSSISKVFWTLSDGVFANSMYLSTDTSNVLGMAPDTSPTFLGINLGAYTGLYTSVAFGFESGSASASKDGAAAVVDSSVFPQPTINRLQIGAAGWGSPSIYLNGHHLPPGLLAQAPIKRHSASTDGGIRHANVLSQSSR